MWVVVWVLQGLVATAAGVYLNTPCIRSLLKCSPFQLSLSEGKFSNSFIEDPKTLNRQCRSIAPLLECMQEAVTGQCGVNISPAEKEFVKTRLFIAEICKDVNYTQKVYLRNAACINRERDWVIQACNPYDYVQLVNTSNLISLEGSCLFQKMLIECRQNAIQDKCGPDAADLYQKVKAVDMNLDFLCLESRDLKSPKFLLDIVINSYISLLLETLRPVLIMESLYLKDIVQTRTDDPPSVPPMVGCSGGKCPLKRAKKNAYYAQDVTDHKWRRFGDVPMATTSEPSAEESNSDYSFEEEQYPVPSLGTVPVATITDGHEAVEKNPMDVEIDLGLGEDFHSDEVFVTTKIYLNDIIQNIDSSDVEISDSSEFQKSTGSQIERASLNTEEILGTPITQFDSSQGNSAADLDNPDTASANLVHTMETTMENLYYHLTTTDFHGMATLCPEYLENTADVNEGATPYSVAETSDDFNSVQVGEMRRSGNEESSIDLDIVEATDTLSYTNLEIASDLDDTQSITGENDFTEYYSEATAPDTVSEENIFHNSPRSDVTKQNLESFLTFGKLFLEYMGSDLKSIEDFFSITNDDLEIKDYLNDWEKRAKLLKDTASQDSQIEMAKELSSRFLKELWIRYSKSRVPNFGEESSTADTDYVAQTTSTEESGTEVPSLNANDYLERASTEKVSSKDSKEVGGIIEKKIEETRKEDSGFVAEFHREITSRLISRVIEELGALFAPKKIERRSVEFPPVDVDSINSEGSSDEELPVNDEMLESSWEDEASETNWRGRPIYGSCSIRINEPETNFNPGKEPSFEEVDVQRGKESVKESKDRKDGVKTQNEHFGALTTIREIAELGAKLNYVLIGEAYFPLEIGYTDGNEKRKISHNLKISERKYKFHTSTPTEPATQIPDDAEFFTTEYQQEHTTEETGPLSYSDDAHSNVEFSESSCPVVTGNQTPRTSHMFDPEKKRTVTDCFQVLESEPKVKSGESANGNPEEANQEIRRSGDVERVDLRNIDMETIVALKFYGDVLTELAALLPPESPDSKTLAKRALELVDIYRNHQKAVDERTDPSDVAQLTLDEIRSRRFQKRSAECGPPDEDKPENEYQRMEAGHGVRFDIGYSPEANIKIRMLYTTKRKADAVEVPVATFLVLGVTKVPIELHYSHKNVNYVHYTELSLPRRKVELRETDFLDHQNVSYGE